MFWSSHTMYLQLTFLFARVKHVVIRLYNVSTVDLSVCQGETCSDPLIQCIYC